MNCRDNTTNARRTRWWRKPALLLATGALALATVPANAQVNYTTSFDGCASATCNNAGTSGIAWTITSGSITSAVASGYTPCNTSAARVNLWSSATSSTLTSGSSLGTSNGQPVDVDFSYKQEIYVPEGVVGVGSLTFQVQWSTDGVTWNNVGTSFSNTITAGPCISAPTRTFTPPMGDPVRIRVSMTRSSGDYWAVIDDISISQAPPTPCAGVPTPGNTTGPATVCAGTNFTLGLQNSTSGTGVTYQWYRSTASNSGPWTSFGAGNATQSTSIFEQTWFYCEVECTEPGGGIGDSNVLEVNLDPIPAFPQPFTTVINPGCWTVSGTALPIWGSASAFGVGSGSARFNFWNYSTGANPTLTSPVFAAAVSGTEVNFDVAGATYTTGEVDEVYLEESNDGGATWTLVALMTNASPGGVLNTGGAINPNFVPTAGQWASLNYPLSVGTNRIRFRGLSDFGNSVYFDNVDLAVVTPCAGPVDPGATESTSGPLACATVPFTLSLENATVGTGVSYVWEISTDGGVTWSPGGGPDAPTWQTSITVPTDFRCVVTCANGPAVGVSNPISIGIDVPSNCYCIPTWAAGPGNGCQEGDEIARVQLNTLDNNSGTGCPSGALGYEDYTDYLSGPNPEWTTDLQAGTSYTITVTAGAYPQHAAVWIDFNDDGIFDNPGERVGFTTTAIPANGSASFNISLACNPPVGEHRMRVRSIYEFTLANGGLIEPCTEHGQWGETEDYTVNVLAPPPCPVPSGLLAGNLTTGSVDLDWTVGCTETAWEVEYGAPGFTPGTGTTVPAGTNVAFTLGGLSDNTTYDAYVRADCGVDGVSASVGPVSFTTLALPPANDLCANAIPVDCNSVTFGTTTASTATGAPGGPCGSGSPYSGAQTAGGVWYTVTGWGGSMTATLCNAIGFDTQIGIFTGSCGVFTCVTGNDDATCTFSGLRSTATWASTLGETYYIYVTGFGSSTGNFVLEVLCGQATPTCSDNGVALTLRTDDWGSETGWQIIPAGNNFAVCSGSGYPNNASITLDCCLPDGCYSLRVTDSFGDGMSLATPAGQGGYVLRDANGNRIIDNARNGANFTTVSAIANNGGFCLPLGTDRLIAAQCDKEDFLAGDYIIARENAAVTAQYGVNNANSGYQFYIFNPNGFYARRVFVSHDVYNGMPENADKARHLNFSWLQTSPLPVDTLLNVRVQGRVNGANQGFGPACRVMILSAPPACPLTQLVQNVEAVTFSCGVTRQFGVSQKIYANPVAGANRYRWNIVNPGEGYIRNITSNTPALLLNWVTNPMVPSNDAYNVRVQASFDNGATYCDYGETCQVFITAGPGAENRLRDAAAVAMWPNPNRGDLLWINITDVPSDVPTIAIDIFDLAGKRVMDRMVPNQGSGYTDVLTLNGDLAKGMYLVSIVAGDQRFTERLVIH